VTTQLLVADVLRNAATAAPHRMALSLRDEQRTFGELISAGLEIASGLAERGVGPGDIVMVAGTVSLDMADLFVGCALAGAIFAPIDPRLPADTIASVTALTQPTLFVGAGEWDNGDRLAPDELRRSGPPPLPELEETAPHVVFFTSGTSGAPKGVVISNRVSVLRSHPGSQLEPRGLLVCPYPLFHMAGWTMAMQQWHARDGIVLLDRADAPEIVGAVRRHDAARLNAIPAVWQRILDHLEQTGQPPLTSLRFADTGTYATPPELLSAIAAAAPGAHVRVYYGSTEVGNVTALDHNDILQRIGSCGRPSPLVETRLGDGDELQVRTPVAFDRYLHDDDATADAFTEGWFRTGDVAAIDDDGFVSIVGRLSQLIRTGGESVSPTQVEQAFVGAAGVADVAVIGLPDAQWGEIVTICVVPESATVPTLDELLATAGDLAPPMRPRRLEIVEAIPRTAATGQVDRNRLVAQLTK
jgi:acyl-CoA synthetase (AMP-forming)/AMP-acid ligase II